MQCYDVQYLDLYGKLVDKFSICCDTVVQAKIMAHALKAHPFGQIEVWQGDALVYERPERFSREKDVNRHAV